jgi:hypothetical protein
MPHRNLGLNILSDVCIAEFNVFVLARSYWHPITNFPSVIDLPSNVLAKTIGSHTISLGKNEGAFPNVRVAAGVSPQDEAGSP